MTTFQKLLLYLSLCAWFQCGGDELQALECGFVVHVFSLSCDRGLAAGCRALSAQMRGGKLEGALAGIPGSPQ